MEACHTLSYDGVMANMVRTRFKAPKQRYFFREWRKHRGLSQEELAAEVDMSASSISQLETGKQGFTQDTLEKLAAALHCGVADLLVRNPLEENTPWAVWNQIPEADRPTAMRVLESFVPDRKRA